MNLIQMSDCKLADLQNRVTNEIARRTHAATNGNDPAAIIYSNEIAKRAMIVAAAGGHSILLAGSPNCGKSMLRAAALELGLSDTFEARPCPCGWRNDRAVACSCTVRQIERHVAKLPAAGITVEMQQPLERERSMPGTTLADTRSDPAAAPDETKRKLRREKFLMASVHSPCR